MSDSEWVTQSLEFLTRIAKISMDEAIPLDACFDLSDEDACADLKERIRNVPFCDRGSQRNVIGDRSATKIQGTCSSIMNQLLQKIIHIVAVYTCVRDKNFGNVKILPIFRVQKIFSNPEAYFIIDHVGTFYENFENYLARSKIRSCPRNWFIIPTNGRYDQLIGERYCNVMKFGSNFPISYSETLERLPGMVENPILIQIETIDREKSEQISHLRNQLPNNEVFDALRQAYHQIIEPGAFRRMLGDQKFIREMLAIENLEEFFRNISMSNRSKGKIEINKKLTIDARAFLQIPISLRTTILEQISLLVIGRKFTLENFRKKVSHIRCAYRFQLNEEIDEMRNLVYESSIKAELEESDRNHGLIQKLDDVRPSEIERLHKLVRSWEDFDAWIIKDIIRFARGMATSLTEFDAASKYIMNIAQRRYVDLKQTQRREHNQTREDFRSSLYRRVFKTIRKNEFRAIKDRFYELRNDCIASQPVNDPRFSNSFTAAVHYDKHYVINSRGLPSRDYFEMAQAMATFPYSQVTWTQDGSKLRCIYICRENRAQATTFVTSTDPKTEVIASLFPLNSKDRVVTMYCYPRRRIHYRV